MEKIIAHVFYQDMLVNEKHHYKPANLEVHHKFAVHVAQYEYPLKSWALEPTHILDEIFAKQNQLCVGKEHPDRPMYEMAGHTSMSIGDYVMVELQSGLAGSQTAWVCAPACWHTVPVNTQTDRPLGNNRDALKPYYDMLATKDDYLGPIDTYVKTSHIGIMRRACLFFTATPLRIIERTEDGYRVQADGYRAGPAGDH